MAPRIDAGTNVGRLSNAGPGLDAQDWRWKAKTTGEIGMTIRIGIVGVGFMGMIHYLAAQKLQGARVTALCSRDPKKLAGDWRSIQGNFGPRGEMIDLSALKRYERLDDRLADPALDLVDGCTPSTWHTHTA